MILLRSAALAMGMLVLWVGAAFAQQNASYPADYAKLIDAARKEGQVVIYSVLGNKAAAPLVSDFKALYPGIEVAYDGQGGSNEITDRYLSEIKAGKPSADVMWSSAMDLQMMLVRDGHAASYSSPEARHLPAWARYKDQAWGTTFEPVVFVYNRKLVAEDEVPHDRASLAALLTQRAEKFVGKVAMFDIAQSGVGFMFAAQDAAQGDTRPLLKALGKARVQQAGGTGEMLSKVDSGYFLLGYNIMGAYALVRSKKELPNLGVVMPRDYTLVLSRVMFISRHAVHPNAARLWADYMLSQRGQKILADAIELFCVRDDVEGEYTAGKLAKRIGGAARPIPLDPSIAASLEPQAHRNFVARWKTSLAATDR